MSRINLIDYNLLIIDYKVVFETMSDLFRSLCFNRLLGDIIDYFSFLSSSEVNKNTLIDYFEYIIDCTILELFLDFGKNTLID